MLVLSRKRNEKLMFTVPASDQPTEIVLTVVDVRGDRVRLGSEAPREVIVDRAEVYLAKQREKLAATEGSDGTTTPPQPSV